MASTMEKPSPSLDFSADPDAEYIYSNCQIAHTVFGVLALSFCRPHVGSIHILEPSASTSNAGSQVYILTRDTNTNALLQGTKALCTEFSLQLVDHVGEEMVEKLQKAYMKAFLCDTSLEAFDIVLGDRLGLAKANIQWVVIRGGLVGGFGLAVAEPEDDTTKTEKNKKDVKGKANRKGRKMIEKLYDINSTYDHSVFQLTSRSGKAYIADFTIEQFGFDPQDWFLPKDEYLERYAKDKEIVPFTQADRMELSGKGWDKDWLEQVWKFCENSLDWDALLRLEPEKRVEEVTRLAMESYDLMQAGRERRSPLPKY